MKVFIIILIFSLILVCCQNANKKYDNQIKTFNLKELPKITSVKLTDLNFANIEYIPLETNEQSLIKRINEIKVGNGFFLIQFYTTILKFRTDGSFVAKIGNKGRGPNEFLFANDVDIDTKNQNIYIVSGVSNKFYVYSEVGEFIRTFQSPLKTSNFIFTEDGILCYSKNFWGNIENSYNLIDTAGRIIKVFPNKFPWLKSKKSTADFTENLFYRFNNRILKKEVYSDTVYAFENLEFSPHLVIEQGERLLTTQSRSKMIDEDLFKYFIDQENLFEFGDYIYFELQYDFRIGGNNIYRGLIASKKNKFQALINSHQGFINDLDGGPNIRPETIKDDNTIIAWVDALQLKQQIASEKFKNFTPKYPENKKKLEKLGNSLSETDNPVLILVKLKE